MALIILSAVMSLVLACFLWLVIGDQLPVRDQVKLPTIHNIAIYAMLLFVPLYLLILFLN